MQSEAIVAVRSTQALPRAQRFAYWADVVSQTFVSLECDAPDRLNFHGGVRHRQIGLVGITDVRASAMRAARTRATIARAPSDDVVVVLHLTGACRAGQRSATVELASRAAAMVTTDECYFFDFPDGFRQLVLKLPRGLLAADHIAPEGRPSLSLTAGPARLLQQLALSSLDDPAAFSADETIGIQQAFADLVRSACAHRDARSDAASGSPRFADASLFIRQHLANPDLTPSAVAAHVGMSVRNLARQFAHNGTTIDRMIWRERLAAARRDMLDPRLSERSITEIAFSWGFGDAAHFSRSFSAVYGIAPSAFRKSEAQSR
ncbi:MAG TPA: helix-turn-helix domain-containing protein [Xanthobacteraceae bacterium]|nr:helix-turn-helix domain-containing protein [Xanthobacteraceae bacterium]